MLVLLHIWNNCFHIGDQELIPVLHPLEITPDESISYTPKMLAKFNMIGTTGSIMPWNLLGVFFSGGTETLLWSSMDSKRSSRIQRAFPEHSCRERMTTCVQLSGTAAGLWSVTLGGCSLQWVVATQLLRWPHQLGYDSAATLLNINVSLGLCYRASIIDLT